MKAVLICGEGPHDVGSVEWNDRLRDREQTEGWLQPIVRRLVEDGVVIKTRLLKQIFLTRRPSNLKPIPKGHSDKAAMAKLIAASLGCDAVIFMTDADTNDGRERSAKVKEVVDGFSLVENDVHGVPCIPQAASECWLLSDRSAWEHLGLGEDAEFPRCSPEDLWGSRDDPRANHPKHVFARVAELAGISDDRETRRTLGEISNLQIMKERCPTSFVEFVTFLEPGR